MTLSWNKKRPGSIEFGLIYGTIALSFLAAARCAPVLGALPSCAFRSFTGIACPTCGTTRALVHLSHGSVLGALVLNPLMTSAVLAALAAMAVNAVLLLTKAPVPALSLSRREGMVLRWLAAILFLANWAYVAVSLS